MPVREISAYLTGGPRDGEWATIKPELCSPQLIFPRIVNGNLYNDYYVDAVKDIEDPDVWFFTYDRSERR